MINVELEVGKYKNCKDRDDLVRAIREYKNQALQSNDIVTAGQYNMVALRLQEICDKLPAPRLKNPAAASHGGAPTKTANITSEEKGRISDDWKRRTGGSRNGGKR